MTPQTVHFLATLIRHGRGVLTAVDKLVASKPASELSIEVVQVVTVLRGVLTVCEQQLSQHEVDEPVGSR